jgi:hypothetical protein
VLAADLARREGLSSEVTRDAFYATLLRYVGCVGFSHEEAHVYGDGDDITTRNVMSMADVSDPVGTVSAIVRRVGGGAPLRSARAHARSLRCCRTKKRSSGTRMRSARRRSGSPASSV